MVQKTNWHVNSYVLVQEYSNLIFQCLVKRTAGLCQLFWRLHKMGLRKARPCIPYEISKQFCPFTKCLTQILKSILIEGWKQSAAWSFYQIRPIFAVAKARAMLWVAVLCLQHTSVLCLLPRCLLCASSFLWKSEVREETFTSSIRPRWKWCIDWMHPQGLRDSPVSHVWAIYLQWKW